MRRLIPAPWAVLHIPRSVDSVVDAHGNYSVVDGDPVIRYVISIFPLGAQPGSGSSKQLLSAEYLAESEIQLRMVIPGEDLRFYNSGDQVRINGSVQNGNYVGGLAFRLDGQPGSDMEGPWPRLYRHFGGVAKIVRVN